MKLEFCRKACDQMLEWKRVHASLDWLTEHHPANLGIRCVICTGDYEQVGKITHLPNCVTNCL